VALELIIGPAHAGKIAALYERYLAELAAGRTAALVVPDQTAKTVTERELLSRETGVVGADVVTFDTLFERIARATGDRRPVLHGAARQVLLRRALPEATSALAARFDRLGSALLGPDDVRAAGDVALAESYATWWAALDAAQRVDRARLRIEVIAAVRRDVSAWPAGEALFAQGFDDLSLAQETLLTLIAQRSRAVVSLPYEAGRSPFVVLKPVVGRLADLAGSDGIVELAPGSFDRDSGLAALERRLGEAEPDRSAAAPDLTGIATAEVEGERGEAEVVVGCVAEALREGVSGQRIAIIGPRGAADRTRLVRQLREAGIEAVGKEQLALVKTPFGRALIALLGLAWAPEPTDTDRLTWLRSPWSGAPAHLVERSERPMRRSLDTLDNAIEKAGEPLLRALALPPGSRGGESAAGEVAAAVRGMVQRAHGDRAPVATTTVREDVAVAAGVLSYLQTLELIEPAPSRSEVRDLLAELTVSMRQTRADAICILDPRDARTIDVDVAIVLGLEEPMFGVGTSAAQDPLVEAPDQSDVARHLVYSAVTRPRRRLVLVRRVSDDEGSPLAATAIWEDLMTAAGDPPPTYRRRFSDAVLPLTEAPTVRERARSIAHLAATDRPEALRLAGVAGVSGAIRRAVAAPRRNTRLVDPRVVDVLRAREMFGVTEIDRFGDCSQIWFIERRLRPSVIDQSIDNRLRVGTLAHTVLGRFYKEVPALLQTTVIGPDDADRAMVEMVRIVDEEMVKLQPVVAGDPLTLELLGWGLRRDLARLIQQAARNAAPLVPTEFEVAFGGRGAQPGRKEGLNVGPAHVSGKIDRIDADPAFTARAMVVDYKTSTISTGAEIIRDGKLQIPLYLLALREVLGREPVGGLLVSIRKGHVRGIVDVDELDVLPANTARADRLSHDDFESALEAARSEAAARVLRIRDGDVRHDPQKSTLCTRFCDYRGICRVAL